MNDCSHPQSVQIRSHVSKLGDCAPGLELAGLADAHPEAPYSQLANVRGFLDTVQVDDDGNVDGIDDALGRVLDRYPWLAEEPMDAPEDEEADPNRPTRTSAEEAFGLG